LKVPGITTTVTTLDVDRQNFPVQARKACLPNVAFQTALLAKISVTSGEASIFPVFKIISYVS
jgi:hypothetical protein